MNLVSDLRPVPQLSRVVLALCATICGVSGLLFIAGESARSISIAFIGAADLVAASIWLAAALHPSREFTLAVAITAGVVARLAFVTASIPVMLAVVAALALVAAGHRRLTSLHTAFAAFGFGLAFL